MWEFLEDWFNQALRQIELRVERLKSARLPRIHAAEPEGSSATGAASQIDDPGRLPSGMESAIAKLTQLANLHSDEYKAAHPGLFGGDGKAIPQHVIVDNVAEIKPSEDSLPRFKGDPDKPAAGVNWNRPGDQKKEPYFVNVNKPGPEPSNDTGKSKLDQLMDKLKSMHSDEYKAKNPTLFSTPTSIQGSGLRIPTMSSLGRLFGGSGNWRKNRLVKLRQGLRRLRRRFTPSPQTMQRAGSWLVRGGRAMQMGAGRLAALGVPGAGHLAAGVGRAGMMAEGAGTAMMAGGGTVSAGALAGGAAVAVIAAVPAFIYASQKMGESMLDSQRNLADWNGSIANSIAQTDIHKMRMDARQAAATAENTKQLAEDMKRLRESTQGVREVFSNLILNIADFAVSTSASIFETKEALSNGIADFIAFLMGTQKELEEERKGRAIAAQNQILDQPGMHFMQALNRQPVVPRPPLRPIP